MNAKIFILVLCGFQLASAQNTSFISNAFSSFTTSANYVLQQAASWTQQLQSLYNNTIQSFIQQISSASNSTQQYAQSLNVSSQQASDQIQACLNNGSAQYNATMNNSSAQLQSQAASLNASLQSASQSATAVQNSIASYSNQAISSFETCLSKSTILTMVLAPFICTTQVTSNIINDAVTSLTNQIQSAAQLFTTAATNGVSTAAQLFSQLNQTVGQVAQSYTSQLANITQQTQACIQQAANATASNSTNTAPTDK